jgi:hypothetical protein
VNKKVQVAIFLVTLGAISWYGWTILRWEVVYKMKVQSIFEKQVGRVPSVEAVSRITELCKEAARDSHIPGDGIKTTLTLELRQAGPVILYYISVHIDDTLTGKYLDQEQQIVNQGTFLDDPEVQAKLDLKIKR